MFLGADPLRLHRIEQRHSFRAALLVVLLLAAGAALPLKDSRAGAYEPLPPLITTEADAGCNPTSHGTCVLPWPSPWMP